MTTHRQSGTKLYSIWCAMKCRCNTKTRPDYPRYGGRGISVCKGWSEYFMVFKAWAEEKGYAEGLSIERKDVNGNYCPENCCWATVKEQSRNRRRMKNNKTGYTGVDLNESAPGFKMYRATWREDNKLRSKSFALTKYGEDVALELAINYRKAQIKRLEGKGIFYGPQHKLEDI